MGDRWYFEAASLLGRFDGVRVGMRGFKGQSETPTPIISPAVAAFSAARKEVVAGDPTSANGFATSVRDVPRVRGSRRTFELWLIFGRVVGELLPVKPG
jgi:hypothetical protein